MALPWFLSLVIFSIEYTQSKDNDSPPHIIVVLADDLGWATVGYHDSEVQTPFLDDLALNEGLMLSRHYVYKFCSPTRSSFFSGRLPIHVNEENRAVWQPGGGVHLGMHLLPSMLKLSPKATYHTHQIGKWHCGMSNNAYLPVSRGFDTSFGYLGGAEDHYTHIQGDGFDLWNNTKPADGYNGIYGDLLYNKIVVDTITNHAEKHTNDRLFIYYAMQIVHDPQQAPQQFIDLYPSNMSQCYTPYCNRQAMDAMASVMDSAMQNVTNALKSTGLWDDTLLLWSADNGGASGVNTASGNNWPLRGGKHSDFEGGIRANAFVSGGYLSENRRGKSVDGYIHICDWYQTFATLAGVNTAALHPLTNESIPELDSMDIYGLINGSQLISPRTEIALSSNGGLISGNYKLVLGTQQNLGFYTGPQSPNTTAPYKDVGCSDGCLFDIIKDPTEHNDLSLQYPQIKTKLMERMQVIVKGSFQTDCYGKHVNATEAKQNAINAQIDGYWAPYDMCWMPN